MRLNCGNAFHHSDQKLLSSHLLSKNIKIRIYKTIILGVVVYGCLRTECSGEYLDHGEGCIINSFITFCSLSSIIRLPPQEKKVKEKVSSE
jgi:hypothetical protein